MEFVHLIGAEDVKAAGHNMQSAAAEFARHISYLDEHLRMHHKRMEELVERMEALNPPPTESQSEICPG